MSTNWESQYEYAVDAETLDGAKELQASGHDGRIIGLRKEIFDHLSKLDYGKNSVESLEQLLCIGDSESGIRTSAGRNVLLDLFDGNNIESARKLFALKDDTGKVIPRDVRTGLRVVVDFDLRNHEMPMLLQEYISHMPSDDRERIEHDILLTIKKMMKSVLAKKIEQATDNFINVHGEPSVEQMQKQQNRSLNTMQSSLNVSKAWMDEHLFAIGAQPDIVTGIYPHSVTEQLRPLAREIPDDEDHYTLKQLVAMLGQPKRWVKQQLKQASIRSVYRRSRDTDKVDDYYSSEDLLYLEQKKGEIPECAEDWMNEARLMRFLGRSASWVRPRLVEFSDYSEARKDKMSRPLPHYPIFVADMLKIQTAQEDAIPEKGENITITEVAKALGKTTTVTTVLLKAMGRQPELRRSKTRVVETYPKSIVSIAKEYEAIHAPKELSTSID